jgi:hypothetical protein
MGPAPALTLIAAMVAAVVLVRYRRQILLAFVISMVTVFWFGVFQIISIVEI